MLRSSTAIRIGIVTPAPPRSRHGNRTTALRWASILRGLGHKVSIAQSWSTGGHDLLVALHARKSFESIERHGREHPERPLLVGLTGTDLYADLPVSAEARRSLELATRLIVLHPLAVRELPTQLHRKVRLIYQSVPYRKPLPPRPDRFEVCVLAHLRPVKDPLRAALASRLVPEASRLRVLQVGAALEPEMKRQALCEARENPRYHWLGELPRWKALQVLSRSRLMVLSSRSEGGANAISEAIACSVPVLASRIPGNVGLLGDDHPGYFPVGDEHELARLLQTAECDPDFYAALQDSCARRAPLFTPEREEGAWRALLEEL